MPTNISQIIDAASTVYQFISLRNPVRLLGQVIEDISRPGVDGHAWRKTGQRGEPFEMLGIRDFETFDDSDSFQTALVQLQGTFVSIYDDFETNYTKLMVMKVFREKNLPVLGHVGGVSGAEAGHAVALAHFRITMVHTALPG